MKKIERKYIILSIANELYAMPLMKEGKFVDYNNLDIVPVPNSSNKVIGLSYLDGKVITILNTKKILKLSRGKNNLVFLFEFNHDIYGIVVEDLGDIVKSKEVKINYKRDIFKKYIKVKKNNIYILDPEDIYKEISDEK